MSRGTGAPAAKYANLTHGISLREFLYSFVQGITTRQTNRQFYCDYVRDLIENYTFHDKPLLQMDIDPIVRLSILYLMRQPWRTTEEYPEERALKERIAEACAKENYAEDLERYLASCNLATLLSCNDVNELALVKGIDLKELIRFNTFFDDTFERSFDHDRNVINIGILNKKINAF